VPATGLLGTIDAINAPEQMVCVVGVSEAPGFTVTFAVMGAPVQPFAVGVMVNATVIGAVVVFVREPVIFPEPLPAIPVTVAVLSLVQLKVVPLTALLNAIEVGDAEQMVCDKGVATATGFGFTRTVAGVGEPAHPAAEGVTVNVTVTGAEVLLFKPATILPDPLAPTPDTVAVLFLVQLYTEPLKAPFNIMGVVTVPEHIVCAAGVTTAFIVLKCSVTKGSTEQGLTSSSL